MLRIMLTPLLPCLLLISGSGCRTPEPLVGTEPETGRQVVLLQVRVEDRTVARRLQGQLCRPRSQGFGDPFDPNAPKWTRQFHVTGLRRECADVTFTCADGSSQTRTVCLNRRVDTGCKSSTARPVVVSLESLQ